MAKKSFRLPRNRGVLWNREDDGPEDLPTFVDCYLGSSPCNLTEKMYSAIKRIIKFEHYPLLVQFWAPIERMNRCLLTTVEQPFALNTSSRGLDQFRVKSMEYEFYVDGVSAEEDLGIPGRVFLDQLPESTPNVKYYSEKECPRRGHALRCYVRASLALPVFDPSGKICVGVLELVTTEEDSSIISKHKSAFYALEEVGLKCSDIPNHSSMQDKGSSKASAAASEEIRKVLDLVYETHAVRFAQTWISCSICRGVFASNILCTGCMRSAMFRIEPSSDAEDDDWLFEYVSQSMHLRQGQGVVGRAFLSHNMLFCTDVTQFSIAEYPLSHYARRCGYAGCFAICLQSSYTGNDVYVLEFFLQASNEANGKGNLRNSLEMILGTLERSFQTFKLASGEDLREDLPIKVIDGHNDEKLGFVRTLVFEDLQSEKEMVQENPSYQPSAISTNGGRNVACAQQSNILFTCSQESNILVTCSQGKRTSIWLDGQMKRPRSAPALSQGKRTSIWLDGQMKRPRSAPALSLQSIEKVLQSTSSNQQLIARSDAIGDRKNAIVLEQGNNDVLFSRKNSSGMTLERENKRIETPISYEALEQHFGRKLDDAAKSFGVSRSTMKRICRQHGIQRWPRTKKVERNDSLIKLGQLNESVQGVEAATSLTVTFLFPSIIACIQPQKPLAEMAIENEGTSHDLRNPNPTIAEACQQDFEREPHLTTMGMAPALVDASVVSQQPDVSIGGLFTENTENLLMWQHTDLESLLTFDSPPANSVPDFGLSTGPAAAVTEMGMMNASSAKDSDHHNSLACGEEDGVIFPESNLGKPPCPSPWATPDLKKGQEERILTIKATYGADTARFRFSSTFGIIELKSEVAKRLELKSTESFKIKYLDDDGDLILMKNDEDLQECLHIFSSSGNNAIKLLIEAISS